MINVDRYRYRVKKKKKKKKTGWLIVFIVFTFLVSVLIWRLSSSNKLTIFTKSASESVTLNELWNNHLYDEILVQCSERLSINPMDASALLYKGFSNFYRAVSEITLEEKIPYIDKAIVALRSAKVTGHSKWQPEVDYILGKAYYHKGKYYYDLAIQYLERALSAGFDGEDICDYLGLAYTQLGEIRKGLECFLTALDKKPTDILLLTIGQNYYQLKQTQEAEEYLIRTINKTDDPAIEKKSRFLLGQLYIEKKDYFKAEKEYQQILNIDTQSANAYFYLGEIYLKMNDHVKARAQWRKVLVIDPTHYGAKLRYYK